MMAILINFGRIIILMSTVMEGVFKEANKEISRALTTGPCLISMIATETI